MELKKIIKVILDKTNINQGIAELKTKFKSLEAEIKPRLNTSGIKKSISELGSGLSDTVSKIGGDFSNLFNSLKSGDIRGALTAARTLMSGLSATVVAGTAAVAGFTAALGIGFVMSVKRAIELKKELRDVRAVLKLNTNDAIAFNAQLQVLTKNFGKSSKELIQASKQVSTAFGISAKSALDMIQKGLVSGADANDDFLDNIEEYGVYFAQAGYSAQEFFSIVQAGTEAGIYNDKLPDAIKELNINLKDGARLARALKGNFSEVFSAKLTDGIKTGAISTKQALVLISDEMKTAGLNAFQMEGLWSNLFAAIGEDVGSAKILMDAINNGLIASTQGLSSQFQALQNSLKIQENLNKEADTFANNLGGPTSKILKDLQDEGSKFLTTILGWVNAATQLDTVMDEIRVKQHKDRFSEFQKSELAGDEKSGRKPRSAENLYAAQSEQLDVYKKKLESLRLLEKNTDPISAKMNLELKLFEGTSQEVTYTWKTLNKEITDTEELIAGLQPNVDALKDLVLDRKAAGSTVNNTYQKDRANIARQAAIDRTNFEISQMREVNDIYYEGLSKRYAEEEAMTKKKYANEIAVANSQAENLVKTAAGLQYTDKISKEIYKTTRLKILAEGDAADATDEQKKKANELRASEAAAAKAKLDQKAELAKLEDEQYGQMVERLEREKELQTDIYNVKLDMMKADLGREFSQTDDLEKQLEIIREQADVELEKLMIKKKQKQEDAMMQRMTNKEKHTFQTTGKITSPDLMFKDGLEVKSESLSEDLSDLTEVTQTAGDRTSRNLIQGFSGMTRDITQTTGAGGGPPGGRPTFNLAEGNRALSELIQGYRVAEADRDWTTANRMQQDLADFQAFVRALPSYAGEMESVFSQITATGSGLSFARSVDRSLGSDPDAPDARFRRTTYRRITDNEDRNRFETGGGGGMTPPPGSTNPIPIELQYELLFADVEYDAEVEKIRQTLNSATVDALANAYSKSGNLTKTFVDEWGNKLKDLGKKVSFQPLERYFKSVEKAMIEQRELYRGTLRSIWNDNSSVGEKIKNLWGAFVHVRTTQFQKERLQIKENIKLLEQEKAYKLKLAQEEADEQLVRSGVVSKTYLDDLRDRQGDEIKLRKKLARELLNTTNATEIARINTEIAASNARERIIKDDIALQDTTTLGMQSDQKESTETRMDMLRYLHELYNGDIIAMDKEMDAQRLEMQTQYDALVALESTRTLTDEEKKVKEQLKKEIFYRRQLSTEEAIIIRDLSNKKIGIAKETEDAIDEIQETALQTRMKVLKKHSENLNMMLTEGIQPMMQQIIGVIDMYAEAEMSRLEALIAHLSEQLDSLNEMISLTEDRISTIESDLGESSGQRRDDLIAQYDAQRNSLAALQMQEQQMQDQREAAEAKNAKLQADAAKRQDMLNKITLASTALNMIAAAAETFRANAKLVFPANVIAWTSSLAALGATFAAAKSIFKFEKGGLVDKRMKNGGLLNGPRHSNGGIPIEAEGGEYVMSREAVSRIGVDRLNKLNFNKSLNNLTSTPLNTNGLTTGLADSNKGILDAVMAIANRPSVVAVEDIMSSSNRVNRVKVDSRF